MRITFLLPRFSYRPIGGYRVVYEYANRLARRGHSVTVVHPWRLTNWPAGPARGPVHWLRIRGAAVRDRLWPRVRWHAIDPRVVLRFPPDESEPNIPDGDVIFATWWATAESVAGYPASKGAKLYLIQHYEDWGGPKDRVDATWRAPLHKVVISRWLVEKAEALGCAPDAFTHVPIGLDFERYRRLRPIEGRPPRVVMMYSSREFKGGPDGIEALRIAKRARPTLEAVLFGQEPGPRDLPGWIRYVRDPAQSVLVEEIYNGSGILLCPSHVEGFHLPGAEAMACGCAVVTTDCGGNRDYARDGETALVSPPGDPTALAENLIRALDDERLRVRIARTGHERIQAFTWERSADRLEALLRSVVEAVAGAAEKARDRSETSMS